jgi:hypothetical protein
MSRVYGEIRSMGAFSKGFVKLSQSMIEATQRKRLRGIAYLGVVRS